MGAANIRAAARSAARYRAFLETGRTEPPKGAEWPRPGAWHRNAGHLVSFDLSGRKLRQKMPSLNKQFVLDILNHTPVVLGVSVVSTAKFQRVAPRSERLQLQPETIGRGRIGPVCVLTRRHTSENIKALAGSQSIMLQMFDRATIKLCKHIDRAVVIERGECFGSLTRKGANAVRSGPVNHVDNWKEQSLSCGNGAHPLDFRRSIATRQKPDVALLSLGTSFPCSIR